MMLTWVAKATGAVLIVVFLVSSKLLRLAGLLLAVPAAAFLTTPVYGSSTELPAAIKEPGDWRPRNLAGCRVVLARGERDSVLGSKPRVGAARRRGRKVGIAA